MSVLIVGSVGLDDVETPFGKVENALGGAAVYAACAASLFTEVRLVGVVGTDFPQEHLDLLHAKGIDTEGVRVVEGRTFRWRGKYDYDLNVAHTLETQLNVFQDFAPKLPGTYRGSDYVFLANINPELQSSVLDQMVSPKLTLCDTMNLWIDTKKEQLLEVLRRVDVSLMNDAEARQLCGTPSLIAAGRAILEMGPRAAVIKKGEHGAVMFTETSFFAAPSYPLEEIVDPTGAGDTFAGALVGYLDYTSSVEEPEVRKAIVYGTVAASFNVEGFSLSRLAQVTPQDLAWRYEELRSISSFD